MLEQQTDNPENLEKQEAARGRFVAYFVSVKNEEQIIDREDFLGPQTTFFIEFPIEILLIWVILAPTNYEIGIGIDIYPF